jgi:hypothetical protein
VNHLVTLMNHDVRFIHREITIILGYSVLRHLSPCLRPVLHYLTLLLYWEGTFDNQRFQFAFPPVIDKCLPG